ncbi:hypothetical protein FQN53_007953 [Emmonsiellopsis sp. PD_33]|nr:hypothetical protein FQN53_007953 [Emmonsiellopsis sp. PD_33]
MSHLKTIQLAHVPPTQPVHVALYRDLQNSQFLREQLLTGNTEFEYAFIDASTIAESFRKFGITDATKDLLVVKFSTSADITHDSVAQHLEKAIEGKPLPFDDENLRLVSDISKIKKAYKLGSINAKGGQNGPNGPAALLSEMNNLERSILGAMALRGS